jgi:hypothetical protein
MDHVEVVETSDSDERELAVSEEDSASRFIANVDSGTSTCPRPGGNWYPSREYLLDNRRVEGPPRKRIKVSPFGLLYEVQ